MPMLVHLARDADADKMLKRGIRVGRGVYCMPVLPDYFISHQWLRELKRRGARTLVAVHFRLPDGEPVLVGHYGQPHEEVTLGTAIRRVREAKDARGYELIVPRSITAKEVQAVRAVPQVTGWRYYPNAKGKKVCDCRYCNRGEFKAGARWRESDPLTRPLGLPELLRRLRAAADADALEETLYRFGQKWRRGPEALEFLMDHPEPRVLVALVDALASFRGQAARAMLARLAQHADPLVASDAREELQEKRLDES